jgi:thioredoxin 1
MIINIQNEQQLKDETKDCKVLIDVWAEWCGPCKMMSPVLYDLNDDLIKKGVEIKILKIDADNGEFINLLKTFGIRSIPTFIIYENNQIIDTVIGALPKQKFYEFVFKNFIN